MLIEFLCRTPEIGKRNQEFVQQYAASENFTELEKVGAEVRACRAVKCFQKDENGKKGQTRFIFSIAMQEELRKELRAALTQLGAEWHTGKAPASGIERQLQTFLDSLAA